MLQMRPERFSLLALFLTLITQSNLNSTEPTGAPLTEPHELQDIHTTWKNLANEAVVYPLDMRDFPVRLGTPRQLFLDNYLIARSDRVAREVHRPRRFEGNPIVRPTPHDPSIQKKENRVVGKFVLRFEESPRFRMWYWSYPSWHPWRDDHLIRFGTGYAVSDDGKTWRKPNLDLFHFEGSNLRNIVLPYGLLHGLFYESQESDPEKRFKALVNIETRRHGQRGQPAIPGGYYLHTSPDGIHWRGDLTHPVVPTSDEHGYVFPFRAIGDTTRFWWDPLRHKYIGDVKFVLPGTLRCRGIMESDDLIHWSRPTPTFMGRRGDDQIYGHRGFVYQGVYVGMRWVFVPERSKHHSSYVELDCSRDGRTWTRVGAGQPFMGFNEKRDTWDAGKIRPMAMFEENGEVWIYYYGKPTDAEMENPDFPEARTMGNCMGLATLPRDRFVSINGADPPGVLLTRPLNFKGATLHVNAEVAQGGSLSVAMLDRDGNPIENRTHDTCEPLSGNQLDARVTWKGAPSLKRLENSAARVQFRLRDAKLYSFWFSEH